MNVTLSHGWKGWNLFRCCTALLVLCAFVAPVRGACDAPGYDGNTLLECTAEECWNNNESIDDGNKPTDYSYIRSDDGSCCYIYGKSTSLAEFFGGTQRRVATLCPKSRTFEGDAVASDLPDTAKSGGKKSVEIGKITLLIVIMMASMFMF
ncbi:hypothetical protein M9434_005675 [Picochlorum sp. BPE23]|nr:hypothetical protein M9434_005675 [Picochlorum sp. BPE23]